MKAPTSSSTSRPLLSSLLAVIVATTLAQAQGIPNQGTYNRDWTISFAGFQNSAAFCQAFTTSCTSYVQQSSPYSPVIDCPGDTTTNAQLQVFCGGQVQGGVEVFDFTNTLCTAPRLGSCTVLNTPFIADPAFVPSGAQTSPVTTLPGSPLPAVPIGVPSGAGIGGSSTPVVGVPATPVSSAGPIVTSSSSAGALAAGTTTSVVLQTLTETGAGGSTSLLTVTSATSTDIMSPTTLVPASFSTVVIPTLSADNSPIPTSTATVLATANTKGVVPNASSVGGALSAIPTGGSAASSGASLTRLVGGRLFMFGSVVVVGLLW